jgi:hypothetical protein
MAGYMSKEAKVQEQYNLLKNSGDLKILFPSLSGDWERDKTRFTKSWNDYQRILDIIINEDLND